MFVCEKSFFVVEIYLIELFFCENCTKVGEQSFLVSKVFVEIVFL